MEIRTLTVDDAGEWLRLRLEALKGDPEAFGASFEEYQSLSLEDVKKRLWSSHDAFVMGAFEDDRLAGMAGFYRDRGLKTRHRRTSGACTSRPPNGPKALAGVCCNHCSNVRRKSRESNRFC